MGPCGAKASTRIHPTFLNTTTSQSVALPYFCAISFNILEPSTMGKDCLEGIYSEKPAQTLSFLLLLGNKIKSSSVNHLASKE